METDCAKHPTMSICKATLIGPKNEEGPVHMIYPKILRCL